MQVNKGVSGDLTRLLFPLFSSYLLLFCYYFVTEKFGGNRNIPYLCRW